MPNSLLVVELGETGHFRRGDCNSDGGLNLSDAVCIFVGLFRGNQRFGCDKSTDADDSGFVNLTDGIFLLNFLFRAGDTPPTPHPDCGVDPSDDALTCEEYSC